MIKALGLVIRPDNESATLTAQRVIAHAKQRGLDWIVTGREGVPDGFEPSQTVPLSELANHCDLVMVIGGDGSLLGAARALAKHDTPVLGVNRGSLGFLTDIRLRTQLRRWSMRLRDAAGLIDGI